MPLKDYAGPANSPEIFEHLVGETIQAAFQDDDGYVYLVVGSGDAVLFGRPGGGPPVYWRVHAEEVREEAKELAESSRSVQSLCHQCNGGDYHEEWSLCDGLGDDVEVGDAEVDDG